VQYQLKIAIDETGVKRINDVEQQVTIVKSVTPSLNAGNLPVAWITFSPLMYNTISWVENYGLYSTTQQLQAGATISMTSVTQGTVQAGWTYGFESGIFQGAQGMGDTFNIDNQDDTYPLSFGLAQQAIVNGQTVFSPLNCVPVLYNQDVSFTPIETLSVFLSSYSDNGVVISQVAGNALVVQLTSQNPSANIGFNDANNTFYLAASASPALL
jgi:hypothetical protein